jgi:hypothetical protein
MRWDDHRSPEFISLLIKWSFALFPVERRQYFREQDYQRNTQDRRSANQQ